MSTFQIHNCTLPVSIVLLTCLKCAGHKHTLRLEIKSKSLCNYCQGHETYTCKSKLSSLF